jgi:hypothetical protein
MLTDCCLGLLARPVAATRSLNLSFENRIDSVRVHGLAGFQPIDSFFNLELAEQP